MCVQYLMLQMADICGKCSNMEKTDRIGFRITPEDKERLRVVAKAEHRTMTNLVELIVSEWVANHPALKKEQVAREEEGK